MYAKKHRPMQKLTAICLSVTIAAASLLSGHVFASDEAPQTDYLTGWELLAELREMGLGQDVILDEEAPESDNSSETNTEDPSDTTGESGDGDQTDGTEPGNPGEGGSDDGDTDPGESTPEQPGDGDQTGGTEPSNPDENNPGEGGSGEGDTDTDTDPGTDNPGEQPDNSDPAAGTDPDEGDGAEQGSNQNQPSAPAESTESAPDESTSKDVPLVTQNDEMTVNDPQTPGETPAPEEDNDKDPAPSDEQTPSEDPGDDETTTTPGDDNTSQNPDENPGDSETTTPPEGETGDNQEPSDGDEIDPGFGVDPSTPIEELPETSGITEGQRAELEAYVQTLDAEQVVSLDETDITVQEYDDLCSMLTADQLAAIEALLAGPNGEEIYNLIMAAQTLDEVNAILDSLDQAGLNALFGYMSEEQYAAMMDWIDVLEQAAIEAALSGGTVNFTNAAPLTGSASAGAPSTVMRRSAARAGLYTPFNTLPDNGLVTSKTVKETANGQYEITLEAYANGEVTMTGGTPIPTDIVLVLDQSGSMANNIATSWRYEEVWDTGLDNLKSLADSGRLCVKVGDQHYQVSVTPRLVSSNWEYEWVGYENNRWYFNNRDSLFYKLDNSEYSKVTVEREEKGEWYDSYWEYTYTYIDEDNVEQTVTSRNGDGYPSIRQNLYIGNVTNTYQYTFSYRDADGNIVITDTVSDGGSISGEYTYYQRRAATTEDRVDALKRTLEDFIADVRTSAYGKDGVAGGGDDIDHRVAMVGFASGSNSEVLTGIDLFYDYWGTVTGAEYSWKNGENYEQWQYNSAVSNALMNVSDPEDYGELEEAINALATNGATGTDDGLTMANDILNAYTNDYASGERQKVVIVFTDGVPTKQSSFNQEVANGAISQAFDLKNDGTIVYTVGIFDGANASNPSNLPDYNEKSTETQKANRFMHLVSSNYPDATAMDSPGRINPKLENDSYYLSAADADTLSEIFDKISDQIQEGTSKVNLDETAVLRDVITPYFEVMAGEGGAITAEVYDYHGEDAAWTYNEELTDRLVVTSSDDGQIDVKGFDYAENYVAKVNDVPHGSKLVVTIRIEAKEDFLGGNAVPTNETTSGIYEKSSSLTPFEAFEVPSVNVPIHYSFTVTDKTIYLSQSQKIDFAAGGVFHDGDKAAKQLGGNAKANDYVDITYTVTDSEDKPVGTYTIPAKGTGSWDTDVPPELTPEDCEELTITCTVTSVNGYDSSIPGGNQTNWTPATGDTAIKSPTIHVLKPTLNFKDTYEDGPNPNYSLIGNQKDDFITWSDFETDHTNRPKPTQDEPTDESIVLTYTWMEKTGTTVTNATVNLTETANFQVNTITINGKQYAVGKDADADYHVTSECNVEGIEDSEHILNRHFTVHLPSEFDLTITKNVPANYVTGETFRFTVESEENDFYAEFTLGDRINAESADKWSITLTGLKPGEYTITEDTGWSWRYETVSATVNDAAQSLTNGGFTKDFNENASVTFTNTKTNNHWLSWEDTIQNIFKAS